MAVIQRRRTGTPHSVSVGGGGGGDASSVESTRRGRQEPSARKYALFLTLATFLAVYGTVMTGLFQFGKQQTIQNYGLDPESDGGDEDEPDRRMAERKKPKNPPLPLPERRADFEPPIEPKSLCAGYDSIDDLKPSELKPRAGERHMVTPPKGGKMSLVCCTSTKGPFSIAVHHKWAPLGAQRFLDMVTSGYFKSIPMMRCIEGFLCQFGISDSKQNNNVDHVEFQQTIPDDPQWLPQGREHRKNAQGVPRFAQGYMAYAGNGPNSRDKQIFVTLDTSKSLGGGSPWEVPWGELVGEHSFATVLSMYTGYGDDYMGQDELEYQGMTDKMKKVYPLMDYVHECSVVDERVIVDDDNGSR